MAIVDALDFLSVNQELTGTSYSQMCKEFGVAKDAFAADQPLHILVSCLGDLTAGTDVTIQAIGYNDFENLSDAFIISTTKLIKADEVKYGRSFTLPLPAVDQKYSYLCLKYVVTGGAEQQDEMPTDPCPPNAVLPSLGKDEKKDNCFNAVIVRNSSTTLTYAYNNEDKAYP